MCNTLSQRTFKRKSAQVKQSISLCSIILINAKVVAISKGGVN